MIFYAGCVSGSPTTKKGRTRWCAWDSATLPTTPTPNTAPSDLWVGNAVSSFPQYTPTIPPCYICPESYTHNTGKISVVWTLVYVVCEHTRIKYVRSERFSMFLPWFQCAPTKYLLLDNHAEASVNRGVSVYACLGSTGVRTNKQTNNQNKTKTNVISI